ncbi:MAG: polysaccharide biosynthesis/export family protein [Planctomycetota bacterium]
MTDQQTRPLSRGSRAALRGLAALAAAALLATTGCGVDSFLDQSVVGRWERTPTVVPILDRIAAIEGPDDEFVELSEVTPDDLIPRPRIYRVGPGDSLGVVITDLLVAGAPAQFFVVVDGQGTIYIDKLGYVPVAGLTLDEIRQRLTEAAQDEGDVRRPLVQVSIQNPRQSTYSVVGAVPGPGTYIIPKADYRMLDALAESGWVSETAEDILVIRQIALADELRLDFGQDPGDGVRDPVDAPTGDDLLGDIDDLLGGEDPSPSALAIRQDGSQPAADEPREPAIELFDGQPSRRGGEPRDEDSTWMFLDGQWIRVAGGGVAGRGVAGPIGALSGGLTPSQLLTQRVIRIPAQRLIAGDMRYNIVVEPGDVIRVPTGASGSFYIAGFVNRPGSFGIAPNLTLMRAIDAAGGVNGLGVPERVELVRMLDGDRQATIMLNLRAINDGAEPDIYIKPNDRINVGSSIWAYPLAVFRNGFRVTYGFGFLLDRNFGNDVFGPPPVDSAF